MTSTKITAESIDSRIATFGLQMVLFKRDLELSAERRVHYIMSGGMKPIIMNQIRHDLIRKQMVEVRRGAKE